MNSEIVLKSDYNNYTSFISFVEEFLISAGIEQTIKFKILTASEEIIVNVLKYSGNKPDGFLRVNISYDDTKICLVFTDNGNPFNPLDKPDADVSLDYTERNPGGLGIFLTKTLMDEVVYSYTDNKNILSITKYIHSF